MSNNPTGKGGFAKGDPRIWKGGRPKSFDAVRELAQAIAHETARAGGATVVVDGHTVTVVEMILRQWAQSKNPQLQRVFMEIAYGKVPNVTHLAGEDGERVIIEVMRIDGRED